MRQILEVARQSGGRPAVLESPDAGWTYAALSELSEGGYYVKLGKKIDPQPEAAADGIPEDEIAAGHTFAILAKSSKSWSAQVDSLLKTITEQQALIVKLYSIHSKALDDKPEVSPLAALVELAPMFKGFLKAAEADKAPLDNGSKK